MREQIEQDKILNAMPPHSLINFEIQRYYQNESNINGIYSRNNLPRIKDGAYVINLDEWKSTIGTQWVSISVKNDIVTYEGVEYIPKEIKKFADNKIIKANIYRMQIFHSLMRGYLCIGFINFMLNNARLAEFTNSFSPNILLKNDQITLEYF